MPSIIDQFLAGGEIRQKREQAQADLALRQQAGQRQDTQLGIQQQDADIRMQKNNTRRFFGNVNELKLLSDQGDWNGVMRVTQNIAQIDPAFAEGSEMIAGQLANMDFEGAQRSIDNSYQLGLDNGLINDPRLAGKTAGQREFNSLTRIAQDSNSTDLERDSARRKLGDLERKGSGFEDRIEFEQLKADIKTNQRVDELKRIETETEDARSMLELRKITIDETKIKNLKDRQLAIDKKNSSRKEARNAIDITDGLLKGDAFSAAFGRFNNLPPEGARSQANIDARAQVDQVMSLVTLESREKLKGQGTITDSEALTLAKSATLLANPLISDKLARKELRRIRGTFEDAEDRNRLKRETIQRQEADAETAQSFNFDAQGNLIQ